MISNLFAISTSFQYLKKLSLAFVTFQILMQNVQPTSRKPLCSVSFSQRFKLFLCKEKQNILAATHIFTSFALQFLKNKYYDKNTSIYT